MLEAERHNLILRILQERSIVSIGDLAELLSASDATTRRDINALAESGQLRRIRGGAEAIRPRHEPHLVGIPFSLNRSVAIEQKRAIARAAAALLEDGDSIVVTAGTTTLAMVEFLAGRQVDILTNSIPILTRLHETSRNRVSLPGGTIFREQNIIISPFEDDTVESFWAQKLFTGCYGLNQHGLMEADPLIVQAQARLLKRTEQIIVMADSRKLRQRSSIIVLPLSRINTLITDDGATESDLADVRAAGVKVIIVSADSIEESNTA